MNYKEMDRTEFTIYIYKLSQDKPLEILEQLARDDEFIDYLNKFRQNYQGHIRLNLTHFYKFIKKFSNLLKIRDMLYNVEDYSIEERHSFFNQMFYYSPFENITGVYLYDEDFQLEFKNLTRYYKEINKVKMDTSDYSRVKKICRDILNLYASEKDLDNICYYLFVNKLYPVYNDIRLLNMYYYNSIINDDSEKVYNDFSGEELLILNKILYYVNYTFFTKLNYSPERKDSKRADEILPFIDLIHKLETKYNYDYFEIALALARDYNINSTKLNKELTYLYYYYKNEYFSTTVGYETKIPVFKNIFSFYKVKDIYNTLIQKGATFVNLLLSNASEKERLIEISYYLLFYNKVKPKDNAERFNERELTAEGRKVLSEYLKGYEEYYEQHKHLIIEEEQRKQEKKEEEKRNIELTNMPKFEKIIMDFINSNGLTISEFCEANNITENEFKYMVDVLEKNDSEVFKKYKNYIKNIKSKRFAILMSKLSKMLKKLVEGKEQYTLLDYYTDTSFSFDEVLKFLKSSMTPDQRRAFMAFKNRYQKDQAYGPKGIDEFINNYDVKFATNKELDEFYEVTKEDKQQVIIMLRERNIPITRITCNLMLKKYFNEYILPNYKNNQLKID